MGHLRLIIILAVIIAAVSAPLAVFLFRQPVLIVTDEIFLTLYGKSDLKRHWASASLTLFRRIKPVMIADGAGPDIVVFAVAEASKRPLCVLFPRSQAPAVRLFHEQFPQTPAVLFSGLVQVREVPAPDDSLYIYSTDRETDLYRAGLFAGILGTFLPKTPPQGEKDDESEAEDAVPIPRTYAIWQDRYVQAPGRELFSRGIKEQDTEPEPIIVFAGSASAVPDEKKLSCVVLTPSGVEYLEKNVKIPIILFSWLDSALMPREVIVQFDDSPWALAVPAVRMSEQGNSEGKIPSYPLIFSGKISDNNISRMLKKSAKKIP